MNPTGREADVRRIIQGRVAAWDAAYANKDVYGLGGYYVSGDPSTEEETRRLRENVMFWTECMEVTSTIREFSLRDREARVVLEVHQRVRFREPAPEYQAVGRWVLGWCRRYVFVVREAHLLTWRETAEGWLCQSDRITSTRLRLRRYRP